MKSYYRHRLRFYLLSDVSISTLGATASEGTSGPLEWSDKPTGEKKVSGAGSIIPSLLRLSV